MHRCLAVNVDVFMGRLTISLDDDLHRALKETAARQGRTIGSIIEEGLYLRGIKPLETARSLVEKARVRSDLTESDALDLGIQETRAERGS